MQTTSANPGTNSGNAPSQQPSLQPPYQPPYQPSVPITVYRQLSAELQNTKERLATVQIENEGLVSQNQVLRQEFTAIATAHQQIQTLVAKSSAGVQEISQRSSQRVQALLTPPVSQPQISAQISAQISSSKPESTRSQVTLPFEGPVMPEAPPKNPQNISQPKPEPTKSPKLYTEEPTSPISPETKSLDSGLTGVWLTLTVICIVLISFGAGYLLMKPFASRSN